MSSESPAMLGARLERGIDTVQARAGTLPGGTFLLGVALAAGVIVGGIATFVLVWAVLVGFFA